jgi:DNA polymerase V
MSKPRTTATRAKLDIAALRERVSRPFGRTADSTSCEESGLELNSAYLDNPEVTIIHRMNQPGLDEPHVCEGDLLVADRRVKPVNGSLVIALIDGEIVVRLFSVSGGRQYLRAGGKTSCDVEVTGGARIEILASVVSVIPVIEGL